MDGWWCGDCKSLNTPRSKSCYSCNLPRQYADRPTGADSTTITRSGLAADASGPGAATLEALGSPPPAGLAPGAALRAASRPRPKLSDARSTRARSRVLLALLVATTAWSALGTSVLMARGGTLGLVLDLLSLDVTVLGMVVIIGVVGVVLTIVTAAAWFVWFDRVLCNVPPLTGAWPDRGRLSAIAWWLVPGVGLVQAPRIVGDVYNRLSVEGTPGLWLLALWALSWIGGTAAPWLAMRVLRFLPLPLDVYLGLTDLITLLGVASFIAAGILAVAMVLAMEHAQEVRMANGGAAVPPPSGLSASEERFAAALRAAAQANAVAKVSETGKANDAAGAVLSSPAHGGFGAGSTAASTGSDRASTPWSAGSRGITFVAEDEGAGSGAPGDAPRIEPRRRPVPVPVLGVALGIVIVSMVVGVLIAGPRGDHPGDDLDAVLLGALPSPDPSRPPLFVPPPEPQITPPPASTGPAAPGTTAARLLASGASSEEWTGRLELEGTLRVGGARPIAWELSVARAGSAQWSRSRVTAGGEPAVLESVLLDRAVWTRSGGGDWKRRARTAEDGPLSPVTGLADPGSMVHERTFQEDGRTLHAFRLSGTDDGLLAPLVRELDAASLAQITTLVTADGDGVPVRAELAWSGTVGGEEARLDVTVRYRSVGGPLSIRSPREGDPVVD